MITRLLLAILMLPREALRAFSAWQQRRPGPTRYIKVPTPEEIEQARAAALDPSNPASFAALANKAVAERQRVEAMLAKAAGVPLEVWLSEGSNSDSASKEDVANLVISGLWQHHIMETGLHPLEAGQDCGCPAQHILATSPPPQLPEATEED